jgi:LAS superfamily LD-carboxypeptidase LdcB
MKPIKKRDIWLLIIVLATITLFGVWVLLSEQEVKDITSSSTNTNNQSNSKPSNTPPTQKPSIPPQNSETLALVNGMISPNTDPRFGLLPDDYSNKTIYVQKPVRDALIRMINTAKSDGIDLIVISGFRSYSEQMSIWQRKWQANSGMDDLGKVQQILKFSSIPGISRHHWGTDIDFNNLNVSYWHTGIGAKTYQWLRANAASFGFCEPYYGKAQGQRLGGYEDEPWHWSYVALARPLQRKRSENMGEILRQPIVGSSVLLSKPEWVTQYVNSISTTCQ